MFASFRVPMPPGMMSTSMSSGAVARVCVGTMVSAKELFGGEDGVREDR